MRLASRIVSGAVVAAVVSSFAAFAFAQPAPTPPPPPRPPAFERPLPPGPYGMFGPAFGEDGVQWQDLTQSDPITVARRLPGLSAEQRGKLDELNAAREKQLAKMREEVNTEYTEKTKGILTDGQKKQFENVQGALNTYREKMQAAEAELLAAGGPQLVQLGKSGRLSSRSDFTLFLNLTAQQKQDVAALQMEMMTEVNKFRQANPPPKGTEGREAVMKYHAGVTEAMEKAQAAFQEKRKAVFTQEQREKLSKIEEAVKVYNEKSEAARTEMQEALRKAVMPELPKPAKEVEGELAPPGKTVETPATK